MAITIYGSDDDDAFIYDTGVSVKYYAQGGNDIVYNWIDGSELYGQAGDDELYNYGQNVLLKGDGGDDYLYNTGDFATLRGKAGADVLYNFGSGSAMYGNAGNDIIYNNFYDNAVDAVNTMQGSDSTIVAGGGNDEVHNYLNERVVIKGDGGSDVIYNTFGDEAVINGGGGKDTITSTDSMGVSIDGGLGGDSILVENSFNTTVNGGGHADVITVMGGDMNDLTGGQGYDQLFGGSGQETMHYYYADNVGNGDKYIAGDGVDTLNLHFTYSELLDLSTTYGYSSVDDYWVAVETKFNSSEQNWFGNYGFNLTAGQFENLAFDVTDIPTVHIEDAYVREGSNGESTFLEFTVNLSHQLDYDVSVDYSTAGITASSLLNADYAPSHGTLTFADGLTHQKLSIEVFGDNAWEYNETMSVHLSNAVGVEIHSGLDKAIGTITNDDDVLTDPLAAPILNSNLAADKIIYLDFDGEVITNTAWNNYVNLDVIDAKAFDKDGDVTSFNADEIESIEAIFGRVAEDFMPFNVNITTDYSVYAAADDFDRLNLVITDTHDWYPGAGGVAYVGIEGRPDEFYQPGWVFSDALGNNSKYIAEAASHEIGHNLGLSHDGKGAAGYYTGHGSGDTGWAPIMGVGYYKELTQWSQGEYNNATEKEDDVAIIESAYGIREDDHGDLLTDATLLHFEEGAFAAEGLIEQRTDVDIFTHTASDLVVYQINGLEEGSNLDILANLYDAEGTLLASSNPSNGLTATIEYQFDVATEVYLSIEGAGSGDPQTDGYSDYGSLGYYNVAVA